MSENSNIEWCTHTFNPWWGCTKVSPACGLPLPGEENNPYGECYAKTWAARCGYSVDGAQFPIWGQHERRRFFSEEHWQQPLRWNRAASRAVRIDSVFCGSMCDILEKHGDPNMDEARQRVFRMVPETRNLMWLFLTKRPENWDLFPAAWKTAWPSNAMLGFTAENQEWLEQRWKSWCFGVSLRASGLQTFISAEPLLGPLAFGPGLLGGAISWVICGGESGPGARPMHPDWARSLRDQCRAAGVPFFMKQMGGVRDKRGALEDLPEDLRIREFPI